MEAMRPVAITTDGAGVPLQGFVAIRDSETMPGRLKVCLMLPTTNGLGAIDGEGNQHELKEVPGSGEMPDEIPMGVEFRLEMN